MLNGEFVYGFEDVFSLHLSFVKLLYVLAVTLCKAGEFQCKDGSCISNYSRCDQVVNCEDASDEMNCRM